MIEDGSSGGCRERYAPRMKGKTPPVRKPRTQKTHANLGRIPEIIARLDAAYGIPEWRPHHDPLSELVLTILSQNTSDSNSGRAFARLLEMFPTWEAVMEAPTSEVVMAIQPGGLAPTKAPRIQGVLREIEECRGEFDLAFLGDLPLEGGRDWLGLLDGGG